jgi:sulfite reductase (NADPH) hemoprotein beta-component
MAESERYLPHLITKVEELLEEEGLTHDSLTMYVFHLALPRFSSLIRLVIPRRMTGCGNGCARPFAAEVAFVGKADDHYIMLLGGGYYGQRLNKIYREDVTESQILSILKPMLKAWAAERMDGEHFGDFVIRKGSFYRFFYNIYIFGLELINHLCCSLSIRYYHCYRIRYEMVGRIIS